MSRTSSITTFLACCLALVSSDRSKQLKGAELDTRPLPLAINVVFGDVEWTGWDGGEASGVVSPLRPILVTHAGDDSHRVFVPTQQGVIYALPDDASAKQAAVFLDISEKVSYDDKTNEEGFLGLAFHPKFRENGRFFVYYTNKHKPHQNVVASYRTKSDEPNQGDPTSERILMVFDKPFWNHDGGTLCFGPDGYLYITTGDGGAANDPLGNGQKLSTWLGKVLRIDVDRADGERGYAIPADNPFVDQKKAKPEIWAYGLRNIWRMAFDRETGVLWAGDVGQDTWEEIDLIERGGNYGWNTREGLHPFVKKGDKPVKQTPTPKGMIDPIFEYHHDLGKSITGGNVYRGSAIPELVGAYLYADYVSGKMWALWYDADKNTVTANREIPLPKSIPVMSFGEDERGETYFTTFSSDGQGIFKLGPASSDATAPPAAAGK